MLIVYKVFLCGGQKLFQLLLVMFAGKGIRVITVRNQNHLNVHSLLKKHIYSLQSSVNTGVVSVIDDGNLLCKSL